MHIKNYCKTVIFTSLLFSNLSYGQTFTKISDTSNPIVSATLPANYSGAAWIDFDNDGDLDLSTTPNFLFRNDGDGNFSLIESGIGNNQGEQLGTGISWADFDNDGFIDCAIAGNPITIYRNQGDGTFIEASGKDVRPDFGYRAWSCAWGDYDNDGYVDLVAAHPRGFIGVSTPSFLFQSLGAGAFNKNSEFEFSNVLAPYTVSSWSDFDLDGDIDLFIGSGPAGTAARDFLYRNTLSQTGSAELQRIDDLPIGTDLQDGQVWNLIDYDNDGDLDAFLTNYGGAPNKFYINKEGIYLSTTNALTFGGSYLANTWGDVDNDGDLDVFITGDTDNRFYLNNGDGTFTRVNGVINSQASSVGATLGDYDNDGDLDLFVSGQVNGLYRNDTQNENSWINIKLTGTVSNKSAIGAKIRAKAKINGKDVWQIREVSSQNSFNSHNSLRVHFGFGDAAIVDQLTIEWPSGQITNVEGVSTNAFYEFVEELPADYFRPNFTADSTFAFNKEKVTVKFSDVSLTHPDNPVVSRKWDFNGDGVTDSEESNPSYQFEGRGGKSVTLIVSTATATDTLSIEDYVYVSGKFPVITIDRRPKLLGSIDASLPSVEDTFYVFNSGDGSDLISVSFDFNDITTNSGMAAIPESFELAPHDSQAVIVRITPSAILPQDKTVRPKVLVSSMYGFGDREFEKLYQFRVKSITSIEKLSEVPVEFSLSQNYPNPFNPSTNIKFNIEETGFTSLKVFDILGREVATIVSEILAKGLYSVEFDGSNLTSGNYFYRLQSGENTQTKKLLLLK